MILHRESVVSHAFLGAILGENENDYDMHPVHGDEHAADSGPCTRN